MAVLVQSRASLRLSMGSYRAKHGPKEDAAVTLCMTDRIFLAHDTAVESINPTVDVTAPFRSVNPQIPGTQLFLVNNQNHCRFKQTGAVVDITMRPMAIIHY